MLGIIGKAAVELMKIGAWGALRTYADQQFRQSSNHFIGEVERGVEHSARKMKIIKDDYDKGTA